MRGIYADLNDVHVTEKLQEVHGFTVCRETVRRLRLALARGAKRPRRAPRYRQRRTPAPAAGSLIHVDGSPHAWLEARGPELALRGAIDDATGAILALHFGPAEDLHGYATLFQQLFTEHGLPVAIYGDRRLAGITTREAANAFLPAFIADFNRRFARPPASPTAVWRRPPRDLAAQLSCRYRRVVARDNTVRLGARWLTNPRGPRGRSYVGLRVDVRELLDGRLRVLHDGQLLAQQAPPAAFVLRRGERRTAGCTRRGPPPRARRPHPHRAAIARGAPGGADRTQSTRGAARPRSISYAKPRGRGDDIFT